MRWSPLPSHISVMTDTVLALPRLGTLTPREREVAWGVARALTNKQLAQELNIKVGTVKVHLVNIYQKTGARNRTVLASWVMKNLNAPAMQFRRASLADELRSRRGAARWP